MSDEKSSSMVQIMLGLFTLIGSLGGAWLVTGAKFEGELKSNSEQIEKLKAELNGQADQYKQLADTMNKSLAAANSENEKLKQEIDQRLKDAEKANATSLQAKQNAEQANTVATNAQATVARIDVNKLRIITERNPRVSPNP